MEYKLEFLSYLLIFKKKNEKISKFDEQIKTCINIFEKPIINENDLKYLFERNILDINPGVRSMCWKLALKHLSLDSNKWNTELIEKKKLYEEYIKSFVINPYYSCVDNKKKEFVKEKENKTKDKNIKDEYIEYNIHRNKTYYNKDDSLLKLQNENNNKHMDYLEDENYSSMDDECSEDNWLHSELFSQINKDTFRTRPELSFFNLNPQQTINSNIKILNSLISTETFDEEEQKEKKNNNLEDIEGEHIPYLVNINNVNNFNNNETIKFYNKIIENKNDTHDKKVERSQLKNDKKENSSDNKSKCVDDDKNVYVDKDKNIYVHKDKNIYVDKDKNICDNNDKHIYVNNDKNIYDNNDKNIYDNNDKSTYLHNNLPNEETKSNKNLFPQQYKNKNVYKNDRHTFSEVCDIIKPKRHYDLLCRILFIYAKIHPYVKYVQGMNEILAPLYFIIFNDPLCNCSLQGEADTFFCFLELMQRQKDVFCEGLDNTDDGINGKLKKFSLLLKIKEYEIWKKLYILKIETQYYALKWILLLLTQEFDMADTIILYDHFIINNNENFILYICLVICSKLKNSLLCGNFTVNLKLLQNIPPFDPYDIINEAKYLMNSDIKNNINITDIYNEYISQKKRNNALQNIKYDESSLEVLNEIQTTSDQNDSTLNRTANLISNIKNKFIVQNIKNYITKKKIDLAKRFDENIDEE
ncbi:putative TBC domain protein [Plasmodium gaboni]|uniref:Putative TBC domain protein n=1 Tax=Plasmodium gaboni TaxID=647221 RepID=A0A151LDI4_9APIC|nr:putative TBC domain protein [Plasmodium gaboni]KYN97001.1 putative TBC domain protein [Plasmodium gaboni]